MNRDRAGRCSANAPIGDASVRPDIISDARRATAGSIRGIKYGSRITRPRCRTPRKIRCSSSNRCCQGDRERDLVITARRAALRRRKLLFLICSYGVSPLRHRNVSRFLEHHEGGLAAGHQSTCPYDCPHAGFSASCLRSWSFCSFGIEPLSADRTFD
jgi:hypothetical protein